MNNEIVQALLDNLINLGWAALIFVCAYLSNLIFSLYYNVKQLGQVFDNKKILNSILKIISIVVGSILLVTAITVLPKFADYIGWEIPEEYVDVFSNLVIIGVCLYMSCKYIFESFNKFKSIISGSTVIKEKMKIQG